jgi:hypothetical protein
LVTSSYILFHALYLKGIREGTKKSTTGCRMDLSQWSVLSYPYSLHYIVFNVYVHLCPPSSSLNFNSACRRAGKVNIFLPKQRHMRVQFAACMWAVRLIMEVQIFFSSAVSLSPSLTCFTTGVDIAMERWERIRDNFRRTPLEERLFCSAL